jgi:hypothetical protein
MKRKIIIAFLLVVTLFLITACGPSKLDDKKATIIEKVLTVNNVSFTKVTSNGDKVEILYESSDATNYDAQIVSDWGMIFATSANFNYSEITIINTINDEPVAKLTATSDNVKLLGNGWLNESEFWDTVKIEAIN